VPKIPLSVLGHKDVVIDANPKGESSRRAPARLNSLTALRFLAALAVILPGCVHFFHIAGWQVGPWAGAQCVSFFFVLSGFLLAYNHSGVDHSGFESFKEIRNFFRTRVARIWPVSTFALFLCLVFFSFDASTLGSTPLSAVIFANVAMVQSWFLHEQQALSINRAAWAVSSIFGCYLLFPLFIHRLKDNWHLKLGVCAIVVAGFICLAARVNPCVSDSMTGFGLNGLLCINPLVRLFEFVLGMCCAELFRKIQHRFTSTMFASIGEIVSLIVLALYLIDIPSVSSYLEPFRFGRALRCWLVFDGSCFFFASLIFFCALQKGLIARALTNGFLVRLGEISYPFVLLHSLGLILFARYAAQLLALGPWPCFLSYLSATTLGAFLVHRYVEKPWRTRLAAPLVARPVAPLIDSEAGERSNTERNDVESSDSRAKPAIHKDLKYIPFLDGLRAFAILSVLTFHNGGPIGEMLSHRGGWAGVDAFFVISGFLITGILLKERQRTDTISLRNFYVRRFLRLAPAYALFIAVTALINPHDWQRMPAAVGIAAIYMCDFDLALGWGNIMGSGMEIAWSLSVEEKFYLFWPTIMRLGRRHLPLLGVLAIAGCFAWRTYLIYQNVMWTRLADGFDTKLDALMIGCLAAMALNNDVLRIRLQLYFCHGLIPFALAAGILLYVRGFSHPGTATSISDRLIFWNLQLPAFTALFTFLVVSLFLQPLSRVTKLLSLPVFVWLGRISYSLYLWHMLAFLWALKIYSFHPTYAWDSEVCGIGMAIVLASISYYCVEQPFLRVKDVFTEKTYRIHNVGRT
jgi:peptidoglycan/LPS O-acetylase OafA/YrhL